MDDSFPTNISSKQDLLHLIVLVNPKPASVDRAAAHPTERVLEPFQVRLKHETHLQPLSNKVSVTDLCYWNRLMAEVNEGKVILEMQE